MQWSTFRALRFPLEVTSWIVFTICLTIYWITADPGASYWDCGEYITTASRLEIGHPPGNPIWMLAMRVATIPFPATLHAYVINLCSGLFMAFAAFFLCRILFVVIRNNIRLANSFKNISNSLSNIVSGFVAAAGTFCFAFCDSAWYSAVEAEVYSMSAMLTSLTLWIMVRWWFERSKSRQLQLLILLSYIIGLSIGVHQLNLLCIPVYALIILYKNNSSRINPLYVLIWIIISGGIVGLILFILIPGLLKWGSMFELLFVNSWGCPYNSGLIAFIFILTFAIITALIISSRLENFKANIALWMFAFIILGFSSFGIILIRSNANPFMNEGNPSFIFALSSYIARDQYPSPPLIFGQTPYSKPMFDESFIDGKPTYSKYHLKREKPIYIKSAPNAVIFSRSGFINKSDSLTNESIIQRNHGGYILADYTFKQELTPELNMWFPRITSRNPRDRKAYEDWSGMKEENMDKIAISEAFDSIGNPVNRMGIEGERIAAYSYRPTYGQNLKFFLTYQSFYMYLRYLLWNFMGRQNDYHSTGEIEHGNFITGFEFIDQHMIGTTDIIPSEIWEENPGHNNYYSIPFLIGIIGIIWLAYYSRKSRRLLSVSTLFFLMTGLAIVVYINQSPGEPRERDYSFLGSYMAFIIWITAALYLFAICIFKLLPKKLAAIFTCIVVLGPSTLMAIENFDDHDRRNRYETTFYASSLLDIEHPSIIFSHGDNCTFPLWYASEVLEMGLNNTTVDVTYLSLPSYVSNIKKQGKKSISTIADDATLDFGAFLLSRIPSDESSYPMPLKNALQTLYSNKEVFPSFPTSLITLCNNQGDSITINLHKFSKGSSYLSFQHLMLLDMIAKEMESDFPRIFYFPSQIGWSFYKPLETLLKPALFGEIYAPNLSDFDTNILLMKSIERELKKLKKIKPKPHYAEPMIADKSRRYRGELVIAANLCLEQNDTILPIKIMEAIEEFYPYNKLSPGNFTIEDTTFYEGKEYSFMLKNLYSKTNNKRFIEKAERQDSLLNHRKQQWLKYYESLTPSQRKKLSNRSKREML